MNKIPVILDTDVFGDPDDFFALLYALANQRLLDVQLIVTADEHRGMRAAWLQKVFKENGISIPVVAGKDLGNSRLFLFESIDTSSVDFEFVKAVVSIAKNASQKITYLCLAPQSNLAECIRVHPELVNKFTVMGMGAVLDLDLKRLEHNVKTDISAFQVVSRAFHPTLLLADHTWDLSMRCSKTAPLYHLLSKSRNPLAKIAVKNANLFYENLYPESRLHDPILVSSLLTKFVTYVDESIVVEDSGITRRPVEGETGIPVRVSSGVEYDKLSTHLVETFSEYY